MAYREPAPVVRVPGRTVSVRLRRRGPGWNLFVGGLTAACLATAWFFAITGTTVRCERAAPGTNARCTVTERGFFADPGEVRFDEPRRFEWSEMETDDRIVMKLSAAGRLFQSSASSRDEATALDSAYRRFVADERVLSFERTAGPGSPWAFALALAVVLPIVWAQRSVDRRTRVTVDLDGTDLVVETRRWLERPRVTRHDYTSFERIVRRSPDTEEDVEELVAETARGAVLLAVARSEDVTASAATLDRAIREERERRVALAAPERAGAQRPAK